MNYKQLEDAVKAVIKENGNEEITGEILQAVLLTMIHSLGTGYQFMGVATSETEPGTPDQKVFYLFYAQEETELANFGLTVGAGLSVILWGTEWTAQTIEIGGGVESLIVPTTWAELKALRDAGELIPGMRYRITDYVATTTQEDTRSANHPFDIIVVADSANTLNENATAIQHDGDEYFADVNLAAWKLKYCLDNDTTRFIWADNRILPAWIASPGILNGEHLPYQGMHTITDYEEAGEVPIYGTPEQAVRYWEEEGVIGWCCWSNDDDMPIYPSSTAHGVKLLESSYTGSEALNLELEFTPNTPEFGKGVVYYLEDEFANKVGFDFKGIQFKRYQVLRGNMIYEMQNVSQEEAERYANLLAANSSAPKYQLYGFAYPQYDGSDFSDYFEDPSEHIDDNAKYISLDDPNWDGDPYVICKIDESLFGWFYLFSSESGLGGDLSLDGEQSQIHDNDFSKVTGLALNVFFGGFCYENTFGSGCAANTFGSACSGNTFGASCDRNTFGNHCSYNAFGIGCSSNIFGDTCTANTFGNNCNGNTLGSQCNNNTFGGSCSRNTFVERCNSNTLKESCIGNTLGSRCICNTFGNHCSSNTFGERCTSNTFGDYCNGNTFEIPDNVQYCTVLSCTDNKVIGFVGQEYYPQIAGMNNAGDFVVKATMD